MSKNSPIPAEGIGSSLVAPRVENTDGPGGTSPTAPWSSTRTGPWSGCRASGSAATGGRRSRRTTDESSSQTRKRRTQWACRNLGVILELKQKVTELVEIELVIEIVA